MTGTGRGEDRGAGPLSAGKELAAVAAFVAVLVGGAAWWVTSQLGPESGTSADVPVTRARARDEFVGGRACRECHPGEAALHDGSGHARTLRPAASGAIARRLDGLSAPDPEFPGAVWSYILRDGHLDAERAEGDRRDSYRLDYALGSNQHGITFVSLVGRAPGGAPLGLEHRLSYFAHGRGLVVTPGQRADTKAPGRAPEGNHLTAEETRMCLGCHATRTSRAGPGSLDPATLIPNVSCERCHEPGRSHVEAARRAPIADDALAMPFGHGAETAEAQVKLCGQCHRLPEFVPKTQIRTDNPLLARFQPVGLLQSRCYQSGEGRLSCTTCHDPHARTSRDRAGYEAACLSCHGVAPRATVCPVSPASGCIDCHMPRREAGNGLVFTDHWIRTNPEALKVR